MHGMTSQHKVQLYADLAEKINEIAVPMVMNANLLPEDFPQVLAAACAISVVHLFKDSKIEGEAVAVLCLNSIYQTCKRNGVPVGKLGEAKSSLVGLNGSPLTVMNVEGRA